ncbi:MAG TPA: M20/M25/M40 family metallo-hydrolase [Chitinophagales bacterium]|nr:M20/M25/M40 family metallo-hydrolase [Chitinophagales bacterium]HQO31414.1 M20/M25/M40 family metallo-hydrolase [Chitinophagales bacterium]
MMQFIQEIISRFGGRYFGSEQEKQAQQYTAEVMRKYCDKVDIEEFQSPLEAHFHSLKIFCITFVMVLILFQVNPLLAGIVGIANAVLFIGHFVTYRHWLDFLYPNQPSWNVIGTIEPEKEVKHSILVAGHIDSVKEFKWWYRLKQTGAVLSVLSGILIALLGLYTLGGIFIRAEWYAYGWWLFAVATPVLIVFYDMHGDKVVDGASDNLTGVAMAVEMAKVFSAQKLQHTRLRVISFGSEEAALRGATAYARKYKQQLLQEKAVLLNLDTIKDVEHLTIGTSEVNTLCFFDKQLIDLMEQSFQATGVACKKLPLGVGASDASAFHINGLPCLSLIGMDSQQLDPAYHTRLDTIDCINPEAMEAMKKVLVHFIERWDKK